MDTRQTLTPDERETTLTMSDGDDHVRINTAQRTVITRLRRKPEIFTETASGHFGSTEWAEFTCPKDRFNLGAAPGEDEGAVQEFLEFVRTQTDVVRIECTALKDPGDWPKIAEFRVESRNDDGGTEIEHWSVQKARV